MGSIVYNEYIYGNYIKYENLKELTMQCFSGSKSNIVNIFIDINSMLSFISKDNRVEFTNSTDICSSIINISAHIRYYYRSRCNVETNIYIIASNNIVNTFGYKGYPNGIFDIEMISFNLNICEDICKYLPNISFIKSNLETSAVIYNIASKSDIPNIIFSKDILAMQLPALLNDTAIFRPYKSKGIDVSYAITKNNIHHIYLNKIKKSKTSIDYSNISPELFSVILCFTGCTSRGIYSTISNSSMYTLLNNRIVNREIYNGYNNNIEELMNTICLGKFSPDEFIRKFKTIDVVFQSSIIDNYTEYTINPKPYNLYDPDSVRLLNDKYFKDNPLDLNRI